jgi:MFS superfamily sulfate permease-like transporter
MRYFTMPEEYVMVFCYFIGLFASIDKVNWYTWLFPLIPLSGLFLSEWLWKYKSSQRTLEDYK